MEEFPFWSLNTIKRITYDLEQKGYLISTSKHNKMKIDNTKWYRIDYEKLPFSYTPNEIFVDPKLDAPPSQHETTVNSQLDAVQTHTGTKAYPIMGRPITKELKNKKNKTIVEKNLDVAHSVIEYLNDKTGKHFKAESAATCKFINGRIKEGYTQEDFIRVIDLKAKQWLNHREFNAFLRPSTLFNATNFENYVNELGVAKKPDIEIYIPPVLDFSSGER
ncbi:hypothetical protein CSV69_15510 [Sporosarcina sp. P26b]|uniref:conserved phage C-terminal domain-containing protein n=1 Tax=Sporosarcina sp. P26b TaxID=2048253 RepID=UPI000C16E548|nr:conserved phage C-terminal domain-containing protein [Sporosarcina sp. P26b]PIC94681.1 hypothetical protein CSV69_15510 [Sporosarcina sp. P26b]